jgi:hypothetical protein
MSGGGVDFPSVSTILLLEFCVDPTNWQKVYMKFKYILSPSILVWLVTLQQPEDV